MLRTCHTLYLRLIAVIIEPQERFKQAISRFVRKKEMCILSTNASSITYSTALFRPVGTRGDAGKGGGLVLVLLAPRCGEILFRTDHIQRPIL